MLIASCLSRMFVQSVPGHSAVNRIASPRFGVCPLCATAVGTVAASAAVSYTAGQTVNGKQVAVAGGMGTLAGSALGGLLYATHLLDPFSMLASLAVGVLTAGLGTWAILSSQQKNETPQAPKVLNKTG